MLLKYKFWRSYIFQQSFYVQLKYNHKLLKGNFTLYFDIICTFRVRKAKNLLQKEKMTFDNY
jgi:hypothetical protein